MMPLSIERKVQVKAFVYCVGQNELFAPLWELDLIDQVICVLLA